MQDMGPLMRAFFVLLGGFKAGRKFISLSEYVTGGICRRRINNLIKGEKHGKKIIYFRISN